MRTFAVVVALILTVPLYAGSGNRLTYLDGSDVYHPHRSFPRLVTPAWVGEKDVEAVVILGIDDMRGVQPWENYLRPVLERLKKIDGRAPVSIMTCQVNPAEPHLQRWLKEGVSLETHTIDHPCPLLGRGGLETARSTFDRCVDLLHRVPNNRPVAFRTPCCDSQNTPSPRFFAEIFNRVTPGGNHLAIDTSVFNVPTANDPEVPRELVMESTGRERFRKYLPSASPFGNFIEDYPYPYVINRRCWEFPCATPSDWQGQHRHGVASPLTLADMKASLDIAVRKQGVFCLVFHPYGWMAPAQVVALIDHAVARYGPKVKFLNFREAHERLNKHLLAGQPLRSADGGDNGVRLLDLDGDGHMDVVIGNDRLRQTRRWQPRTGTWAVGDFPATIVTGGKDAGARFGVLRADGRASLLTDPVWHYSDKGWERQADGRAGLEVDGLAVSVVDAGRDRGVRLRDLDGDGVCELLVGNERHNAAFAWSGKGWRRLPYALPDGARLVDAAGRDAGLRFVDLDEDGVADVLYSNDAGFGVYLFDNAKTGWKRRVIAGKRGQTGELPAIIRTGTDNGFWFHSRQLWWQNEGTALLPGLVERRSFNDLLRDVEPRPRSTEAALRALTPRPGFQVEQVAAEPLVMDPITFAWGADGRLWVVEMGDYPLGVDGKGKPGGRVVVLEDTNGDGKYDKRTVFLDDLGFPTGVLPWRKGALVTCAPDILYAEDVDGDGKADRRVTLYTGFKEGNQQHRVNSLVWGLDNWIHVANGDSGGAIRSLKTGKTLTFSGRDLRIRPDTGELDAQTGQTQYGRSRDDHGNWFGGNNSVPMWHFVLADHYVRRNPHYAPPAVRVEVPAIPGAAPVFARSRLLPRFNDPGAAGRFTSACSPIVYRDDLFGPAFSSSLFVCEPVHNLVHREVITPDGVTFTGRRAVDESASEFLASTDHWFRPTTVQTGPDGAVWVADMYRAVIEHPEWIPLATQKRLDLRAGHDLGRIYRVFPVGRPPRALPRLDRLDLAGLAAALDSPSGWQRDTAHQMLLWKKDPEAIPHVEKQLRSSRAVTRLQALCVLDGLAALTPVQLTAALADADAGVRKQAVRLCEGRLPGDDRLAAALLARVDDESAPVRLQLACSLGEWTDARAGRALGRLLRRDLSDRFIHAAAMTSLTPANLSDVVAGAAEGAPPPAALIETLMRQAAAMNVPAAVATLLDRATDQPQVLAAFLDGLAARGSSLATLGRSADPKLSTALRRVEATIAKARARVTDDGRPADARIADIALLGREPARLDADRQTVAQLLEPTAEPRVQATAVAALARMGGEAVPGLLLTGWKGHAPALRSQILEVLLQRASWTPAVLAAIETKAVLPLEIDSARRQQLLTHRDRAVRARAEKAFAGAVAPDRQKVIDGYQPATRAAGDATRGQAVFVKVCAACHKLGDLGQEVGPDLAGLADKSSEYMLIAILDPNRAVEARYLSYQAETVDGRVFTGILTAETGSGITLVGTDGKPVTILRRNLERMAGTGKSLMPEGIEKDVSTEAMADLLAFLRSKQRTTPPKTLAGNRPEPVRPDRDGVLHLTARNAEVHGPSLIFEAKYGNLGYWSAPADRAVWTVEVPRGGKFQVWLDHACDPANAGNTFVLEADAVLLRGKVESTGTWDDYRQKSVGTLTLPAGSHRLTMRPDGALRGAMIDLRSLRLVPVKP